MAMVYTERVAELGAKPSTGTVGDSGDALAETINNLYTTELIRHVVAGIPWVLPEPDGDTSVAPHVRAHK